MRLSPWSGGSFAFLDGTTASPEPVRFGPWRDDRRGVDDGYSGASLVTGLGLGLARPLAAAALPLPALAAALAVVAGGLAGLEGVRASTWQPWTWSMTRAWEAWLSKVFYFI